MAVFAFDLDGTICFDGRSVAPVILSALEELVSRHQLIIASARHPVNMLDVFPAPLFARLDVVGANGAIAFAAGVTVHHSLIGVTIVESVLETLRAERCAYLAYGEDFVVISPDGHAMHVAIARDLGNKLRLGSNADLGSILKVLALPQAGSTQPLQSCRALGGISIEPHRDGTFDVMSAGVDKTSGIRALIAPEASLFAAFGNDINDLSMLALSKHAVAVGDHPALQRLDRLCVGYGLGQEEQIAALIRHLSVQGLENEPRTVSATHTSQVQS